MPIVIWLLETFPDIDIHIRDDYAFRWACGCGHINVAIWLLINTMGIDINVLNDSAFQLACEAGHLEVAQWLVRIGNINIRVHDDKAFLLDCRNRFKYVVVWLLDIYPDLKSRVFDDFPFKWRCVNKQFDLFLDIECFN